MPNQLDVDVLRRLAKLGAQARLDQIETERRAILAAFPDLAAPRRGGRPAAKQEAPKAAARAAAGGRRRRRRKMTPEQRKEVSDRMKRYWAARRAKK